MEAGTIYFGENQTPPSSNETDVLQQIDHFISQENYEQAFRDLRLFVRSFSNQTSNESVFQAYALAHRLIPHIEKAQTMTDLKDDILERLNRFPFKEQQRKLALELGKWSLKNHPLEAMHYYAKARLMAKEDKTIHEQASKVLITWSMAMFEKRLSLAYGGGDPAQFEKEIERIANLKPFLAHPEDQQVLCNLYEQAKEILLQTKRPNFDYLSSKLQT